jgi:hypothetical protein
LPGEGEAPSRSGFNKLHTFIHRILGPEAYELAKQQTNGDTGKMLSLIANRKFGCSVAYNDGGRKPHEPGYRLQAQINIMSKFVQIVA